jgi:hypothetical protein
VKVEAHGKNNQAASSRGFKRVIDFGLQHLVVVVGGWQNQRDQSKDNFLRVAKSSSPFFEVSSGIGIHYADQLERNFNCNC